MCMWRKVTWQSASARPLRRLSLFIKTEYLTWNKWTWPLMNDSLFLLQENVMNNLKRRSDGERSVLMERGNEGILSSGTSSVTRLQSDTGLEAETALMESQRTKIISYSVIAHRFERGEKAIQSLDISGPSFYKPTSWVVMWFRYPLQTPSFHCIPPGLINKTWDPLLSMDTTCYSVPPHLNQHFTHSVVFN